MNEHEEYQVPVKGPYGRVIAEATVTETDDGLMTTMELPPAVDHPLTAMYPAMSFAFREPDPDLMPHDPLAPKLPTRFSAAIDGGYQNDDEGKATWGGQS